ncbi:hypothetical protein [Hyphococcus luteus]|uniref:Cell envelope biogenesis protein TolA n=1 Tax=Hyphococcus luteus TaxID=2058213 RepID=A0A2S7K7Z3_9PROT|nr:hypothetical protein [Marinicaulis flavus]PQA88634.1 hypothetical protein CW354_10155 [Marinicaulis flavus]
MRFGLFASVLFHLAIIFGGLVWLPSLRKLPDVAPEPYIPLELIEEAELDLKTSVPAAAPEPVEEEEPEPDLPEPVEEDEPAPAEEASEPVSEPEPEPEPVAEEPEPEPEPVKPEPEPKPEPPKETPSVKPEPKNDELDLDALSKLIDKERETEQAQQSREAPSQTTEQADKARPAIGAGDRLTASDEAKLKAAMAGCWNASAIIGAPEPERLLVVIDFELNRDGTLSSPPRVVNELQINLSGNRFWRVAQREAVSAVVKCAPYDFLPPERYETWKEFRFNFSPSDMVGR